MDENSNADGDHIHVGSPFAVDPPEVTMSPESSTSESGEPIVASYATGLVNEISEDAGPLRYTALGALAASLIVILFAGAAAWWFPAGGALIAALGCLLAIFGLFSNHRIISALLIVVHLGLFIVSYGRSLS